MSTFRTQSLFSRVSVALHHEIKGRQGEVFHPGLPADGCISMTDHVTLMNGIIPDWTMCSFPFVWKRNALARAGSAPSVCKAEHVVYRSRNIFVMRGEKNINPFKN